MILIREESDTLYRVMVRSFEGWRLTASSAGTYWERRAVWSTWQAGVSYEDAMRETRELRSGGVHATPIPEGAYESFCGYHAIC